MADPFHVKIPTIKEIFVGDIARSGNWIVACVKSGVAWPVRVTNVKFRNRVLYLIPPTVNPGERAYNTFPSIALALNPGERMEAGQVLISQFLSSLAWVTSSPIRVVEWTGGNLPRPMGGFNDVPFVTRDFYHPYLPDPSDRDSRLALAFYREGLGLNHAAYQCLSFFKVLNLFLRTGTQQEAWINANFAHVTEQRAKQRASFLVSTHGDVGRYLYGSNRCAVAHAGGSPSRPGRSRRHEAAARRPTVGSGAS